VANKIMTSVEGTILASRYHVIVWV